MLRALKLSFAAYFVALAACAICPRDGVSKMRFVEAAGVKTHVEI
jgi:hypothetical protein